MSSITRIVVGPERTSIVQGEARQTRHPARVLLVDAAFVGLAPPAFASVAEAVTYARAYINDFGGEMLIRLFHDTVQLELPEGETASALEAEGIYVDQAGRPGTGGGEAGPDLTAMVLNLLAGIVDFSSRADEVVIDFSDRAGGVIDFSKRSNGDTVTASEPDDDGYAVLTIS